MRGTIGWGIGRAALLVAMASGAMAQITYIATDIGTLGGPTATATAININGQVVGYSPVDSSGIYIRAFLYTPPLGQNPASMVDLGPAPPPGGSTPPESRAFGINSSGQVVGWAIGCVPPAPPAVCGYPQSYFAQAFLYSNGTMTDLGTLGGNTSHAYSINDSGQIAGDAANAATATTPSYQYAALWSGGSVAAIGPTGTQDSIAIAINNSGEIVGGSNSGVGVVQIVQAGEAAFLFNNGMFQPLSGLSGSASAAESINSSGSIVGNVLVGSNFQAFLSNAFNGTQNTGGTVIPSLGGATTVADGINDSGQIVGASETAAPVGGGAGAPHAYSYCPVQDSLLDLNTVISNPAALSGTTLKEAVAINASGQIAVNGVNGHAYLLTPLYNVPLLSNLSPSSAVAGGPAFTLTVTGQDFISGAGVCNSSAGAIVFWNGVALTTTIVSSTELTAQVPASLIAAPGTANVTVANAGSAFSSPATFTIDSPAVTLLSPANGATGIAASPGPVLSWSAFVGVASYNVCLGTTPSPSLAASTAATTYPLGTLSARTTYYWTVTANGAACSTAPAVWSFTTAAPATQVTFQTVRAGLQLTVDGASETAPVTLSLTQGMHIIAAATQTASSAPGTQYVFINWSDNGTPVHTITVGAAPVTYTANFQTQYQLTMAASPAAGGAVTPATGAFYNAGTVVAIAATTNAGYSFNGWSGPAASASSASTSVTMSAPETLTATFSQLQGITIQTNPPGLQFSLDGATAQTAPATLNLTPGTYTIAVMTTQAGQAAGTQYAFASWSDGGAASHSITVGSSSAIYTATFITQYQLTISASPVAGGTVTPASGGFYNAGTAVTVAAAAANGYRFNGWTGSVTSPSSASTTVAMAAAETVTAGFIAVGSVTIQTNPSGLPFTVDSGAAMTSPQTLILPQGSHTIAVAALQAGGAAGSGTQYLFVSWSDNGAASHTITVGAASATYTATFQTQYQLTISASPAADGTVTPASGTYYNAGSAVTILSTPNSGYQFTGWTGAVANASSASTVVTMSAPETVVANFSALCTITLTPASVNLPATGTSTSVACPNSEALCGVYPEIPQSFTVTPSAACGPWTATSSAPGFLQVLSGAGGTGAGAVTYAQLNNTHNALENNTITVATPTASATFTVIEAGNPNNETYRQIYALYEQFLGRDPDAGGFTFWSGVGGTGLGQMGDDFLTSPEFFNSGFAVMAAYQAATGAPPTYSQYTAAVAGLRAGAQTVPGLFTSLTGAGFSSTTLYQNLLNRVPGTADSGCISAGLSSCFQTIVGYPANTTPVSAPNNEFQSTGIYQTTLAADHTNSLYMTMVYFVTLNRDPDPSGFAFWLGIANQGGPGLLFQGAAGYFYRNQILGPGTPNQGFIGSPEFQGLFAN